MSKNKGIVAPSAEWCYVDPEYRPQVCCGCDWSQPAHILIRSAELALVFAPGKTVTTGRLGAKSYFPGTLDWIKMSARPTYSDVSGRLEGTFAELVKLALPEIRERFGIPLQVADVRRYRTIHRGEVPPIESIWPQPRHLPQTLLAPERRKKKAVDPGVLTKKEVRAELAKPKKTVYFVTYIETRVVRYAVLNADGQAEAVQLVKSEAPNERDARIINLRNHRLSEAKPAGLATPEEWKTHPENPSNQV